MIGESQMINIIRHSSLAYYSAKARQAKPIHYTLLAHNQLELTRLGHETLPEVGC